MMNVRIIELFLLAGGEYESLGESGGYITRTPDGFDAVKFAMAIASDCMDICEELGDDGFDGHYCVDAIRSVYGVAF